jgi:SAM-dependent methyltransferase
MDDHSHHVGATELPDDMAEMLDLDGEVLHAYLSAAVSWVRDLTAGHPPHRIIDLGSGTGTATIALAQAFPAADVLALDSSDGLLTRVEAKARSIGAVDRIIPIHADLDAAWPAMEAVDVAWASMSLHHLADPDRVLAGVLATLRPGGLIAVAEMDDLPRFLPDDLGIGRPGLEQRCHHALAEAHARQMPSLGLDWGPRLSLAGFDAITRRTFAIDLDPPLPPSTGRYAQTFLQHIRSQLDGTIDADDQTTLDTLIKDDGRHSVLHRHDLAVRGTRTVWAGLRP